MQEVDMRAGETIGASDIVFPLSNLSSGTVRGAAIPNSLHVQPKHQSLSTKVSTALQNS
jgi:hypothetical protein